MPKITKDMAIGDVVSRYPKTAEILFNEGFHCAGCQAASFETLEQGLAMHGKSRKEIDGILKKLNKTIQKANN